MPAPASLIAVQPGGRRTRIPVQPLPFQIGRHASSNLVLRDSRASRNHARIDLDGDSFVILDAGSRHGVYVNGKRVERQLLKNSDRIEFGYPDSIQLIFAMDGAELNRILEQFDAREKTATTSGAGVNLAKLRAVLDVARSLQTSLSMDDVLNAVIDAALAVTGADRGFLLLRDESGLTIRVARDRRGNPLTEEDLRVPRRVIERALQSRRELLSMRFDAAGGASPEHSVADLELRSVICVPLVRLGQRGGEETGMISTSADTAGVLYMDSRSVTADLAGGNRELLQTLAIEASTILENARLLEEERAKQRIEEELDVARAIQQNLLPRELPSAGWFRAHGSSTASHQVGGDYFDVSKVNDSCWAAVVADVAGKGVSSALLASVLQGAFLAFSESPLAMRAMLRRINRFLSERTEGASYATLFCCTIDITGAMTYVNAGHCAPIVLSAQGRFEYLEPTATPVGLLEDSEFDAAVRQLAPSDKLIVYSDGVTEAQNTAGEFFGRRRLREAAARSAAGSCRQVHDAIQAAVAEFADAAEQSDDITLVVLEYRPEAMASSADPAPPAS